MERELARYGQEEDGEEEGEGEGEGEDGAADSDLVLLDPSHVSQNLHQCSMGRE